MTKCYHCGKSFDYEKYYGICPKCSAYNREEIPEELHQKLQGEYDTVNPHGWETGRENEKPKMQHSKKKSGVSAVVFVCLMIGIIAGVQAFADAGRSLYRIARQQRDEVEGTWDYETEEPVKQNKKMQSAEVMEKQAGESFVLGDTTRCSISVKEAYILKNADTVEEFPKGQNLVAVKIDYECLNSGDDRYHEYMFSGTPYAGYQGVFKECVNKFSMETYRQEQFSEELLNFWDMKKNVKGTGIFLVFVPAGITQIQFYMDSRVEDTNDISAIYSVPLKVKTGEV